VQNTCELALIYLQLPGATSSPTLPVVSEWYQKVAGDLGQVVSEVRGLHVAASFANQIRN
jgi:hypothetical protein